MKIKTTVELIMEMPNEEVIKEFYDKSSANNFELFKQDIINSLIDDDWTEVNMLEFSVEDVDISKFHSNKPIK